MNTKVVFKEETFIYKIASYFLIERTFPFFEKKKPGGIAFHQLGNDVLKT